MDIIEIIIIAVGLSMDAFAVSVCKGLSIGRTSVRQRIAAGLWFGGFQALMPLAGFYLGSSFSSLIDSADHWIAFGLLAVIGANMLREAFSKKEDCTIDKSMNIKQMFILAIATSIDALAVGVSMAFLEVSIWYAIAIIGATTFAFSYVGMAMGSAFGIKYKTPAEIAGGFILIAIGFKILFTHLLG